MIAYKKVQLSLRISNELSEKLKVKAKEYGISVNSYVTMILSKECQK